jgi:hypothetical protein
VSFVPFLVHQAEKKEAHAKSQGRKGQTTPPVILFFRALATLREVSSIIPVRNFSATEIGR